MTSKRELIQSFESGTISILVSFLFTRPRLSFDLVEEDKEEEEEEEEGSGGEGLFPWQPACVAFECFNRSQFGVRQPPCESELGIKQTQCVVCVLHDGANGVTVIRIHLLIFSEHRKVSERLFSVSRGCSALSGGTLPSRTSVSSLGARRPSFARRLRSFPTFGPGNAKCERNAK